MNDDDALLCAYVAAVCLLGAVLVLLIVRILA